MAYAVAAAAERSRTDTALGYRLYYLAQGRFGSFDVRTDPLSFTVVGRHAMCDVVLDADPTIALRHLLVRARRLDDGCPRLSILDLQTHIGFEVSGGKPSRSISATGPIAIRVGAYAIVALPGGEALPAELPDAACAPALAAPKHPYRDAQQREPRSIITLLPAAMDLGEARIEGAKCSVMLWGSRGSVSCDLSVLDLDLGVLVGRAPKCNESLKRVLHDGISRVHVLLYQGVAYDLASTQGTYESGARIRATTITAGAELQLGTVHPVFARITPR